MSKHSSAQFTPATPPPTTTTSCCSSLVIRASVRSPAPDATSNGGPRYRIRRSTPSAASSARAGESASSHCSSNAAYTVTRKRVASRPALAHASRAVPTSSRRRGCPAGTLIPSPTRPAISAIFGPKAAITTGGGGSGRRNPGVTQRRRISSTHALHLRPAHGVGRDGASDRRLLAAETTRRRRRPRRAPAGDVRPRCPAGLPPSSRAEPDRGSRRSTRAGRP